MCVYVYMHVSRKCEGLWNQRYKQMKVSNIYGHFEYTFTIDVSTPIRDQLHAVHSLRYSLTILHTCCV